MLRSALLAATALTTLVTAQNYSTSGPLSITASQVDPSLRQAWCTGQLNNCPLICGGSASANTCDDTTLAYTCTCSSGATPNISAYSQTMPFYICEEWINNCLKNHPNERAAQQGCQSVTCGQKNASELAVSNSNSNSNSNSGASSSSSAASMSMTSTASSSTASASASSTTAAGAAAVLDVGMGYGTSILSLGMLVLFGVAL